MIFFSSCLFVCLLGLISGSARLCCWKDNCVFSQQYLSEDWNVTKHRQECNYEKGKLRYHHKSAPLLIPVVWVWALAWVLFCVVLCSRVRCFTLTELLLRRSINGYWKTVEETSKNAPGSPVIDKPSTRITCHTALYATETTKISPNSYKYRPGGP